MFKQWMLIISLFIPLTGCSYLPFFHEKSHHPTIEPKLETLFHKPDDFTRVDVRGEMILNLHTGARRAWFSMHGDSRDLTAVEWSVKNKTLRVRLDGRFPKHGPVTIDVGLRQLDAIIYDGSGNVTGRRLYSKQLDVYITNTEHTTSILEGRMKLRHVVLQGGGTMQIKSSIPSTMDLTLDGDVHTTIGGSSTNLNQLDMTGNSYLSLSRVKTKSLKMMMKGHARAKLSGTANLALVDVAGKARYNGRYLRVKEAFVKTHGYAIARIFVSDKQHTLASNRSNIYYYNVPTYQTDLMAQNGTVLNLGAEEKQGKHQH